MKAPLGRERSGAKGDLPAGGVDAGGVQYEIHFVGPRARCAPGDAEGVVAVAAAFGTGTVAGGERHGFIQEEELGVAVRGHDFAMAAFEFEDAGDPAAALEGSDDLAAGVVQAAAAIAQHGSASGGSKEGAVGVDAILEGHASPESHEERRTLKCATGWV
jgi:hypothetical protein